MLLIDWSIVKLVYDANMLLSLLYLFCTLLFTVMYLDFRI